MNDKLPTASDRRRATSHAQRFSAVLFDLDGTLLDTLTDLANAMNRTLEAMGFPPHPVEAYKYFVGDGVENEAKRALPKDKLGPDTILECVELARAEYARCWHENTRPYHDIGELLTALIERDIIMTILSNKPDHFVKLMVEKLLPDRQFEIVRGAIDGVPIKPDPAAALAIAKQLNIPPKNFLYLGDTNTDMKTAVNSEMYPVGATWGFRTADELTQNGAKTLIHHPTALLNIVDAS